MTRRRSELIPEHLTALAVLAVLLWALASQGCGNAHGPTAQVGAYGVRYPGTAANQAQLRAWLDEALSKAVELVGQHLGPGAYWPRAGVVVWHPDGNSLASARSRSRTVSYSGWAGWIDEAAGELHVVTSARGTSLPLGALGHLLEHWHRGDLLHQSSGWPRWDADYQQWDAVLWSQR